MIKSWIESAPLSIFKGKYLNQADQSGDYNQDSSDQSRTSWVSSMLYKMVCLGDIPGGAVVKNPPAIAGNTGSSPGPGRSHARQSN